MKRRRFLPLFAAFFLLAPLLANSPAQAARHHRLRPRPASGPAEAPSASASARPHEPTPSERYVQRLDELSALWSAYRYHYIQGGQVASLDEGGVTTSEGQSYAMLRAVWQGDRTTFRQVWKWTRDNLQIRAGDKLFAWKWNHGRALDLNSATDADSDIALALLLASQRFGDPEYAVAARPILADIWRQEIVQVGDRYYVTAGNWAPGEEFPTLHVAYFAPYAYGLFARIDRSHPWEKLVESSYRVLDWIYFDRGLPLPPEVIYLDKREGGYRLESPRTGQAAGFGYDAYPIFWRMAMDALWSSRHQGRLRAKMLEFFQKEWRDEGRFMDRYALDGRPLSKFEGLPLYATVESLAEVTDSGLASKIRRAKLSPLWARAMDGQGIPYYAQNWLWFGRAFELQTARTYDDFLGFLRPFDFEGFWAAFPWVISLLTLSCFLLARFHPVFRLAFLASAFFLCARYLVWRWCYSLNTMEPSGPVISFLLWAAEFYCFSTVLLLVVQVGLGGRRSPPGGEPAPAPALPEGFAPSVDVFIPIYSESCEILEKTLIAALSMRYPHKRVYVTDDSHREEVRRLTESLGGAYIKGPKKHAKAGNLNNAMKLTSGELIVIFDTDHIPVSSFLEETIPPFQDPQLGFVQTPHHFYNEDIFQRALGTGERVPDEQDMFNHAIQGGRDAWGGSFFVGSGAVFRRVAMERLGGFKLMSITEDIHTSQHLHAQGWKSRFIDKDLAVGLTAENLSSFIVQRRRWMLGCLQIFFKDNPLFCRGLPLRHRLGYFASLFYFLFPIPRVVFWATPLLFLLFHWHPIFAEVSVLLAYLVPYMVVLPLISAILLPGWPRIVWGSAYEAICSFVLFRSIFDLFLPRNMGFKVTPKGIVSNRRSFDAGSSKATLIATGITLFAIGKGLFEFYVFGIEKDAYFFNLIWATVNLSGLLVALLIAWERPQRRAEERIRKPIPFELRSGERIYTGVVEDISLSGLALKLEGARELCETCELTLHDQRELRLRVRPVHMGIPLRRRHGFRFVDLTAEQRRDLLLITFAAPDTWRRAHAGRSRTGAMMILHFLFGIFRNLKPLIPGAPARTFPASATPEPKPAEPPGPRLQLIGPAAAVHEDAPEATAKSTEESTHTAS